MNVWRAIRVRIVVSAVATALIVIASVVFAMFPSDADTNSEDLAPLSPSGGELLMALGGVVFILMDVVIADRLRGSKQSVI